LIKAINNYITKRNIPLQNELLDKQAPEFLALIDSIDFTLLDLIPIDTLQQDISRHIDELLERTLARRYCVTPEILTCLRTLFSIRADHLQGSVTPETWPILRKSGTSPRLWQFVTTSGLLENHLWQSLINSIDGQWLSEVILKLREFPSSEIKASSEKLLCVIEGWMSGFTYAELAEKCGCGVDEVLRIICQDVGYHLQEYVAKTCQLAIERYGDEIISKVARNWSSLLQFGLGTLQQLDLFERGCSERLAAWGALRYLETNQIVLRGNDLIEYLRDHGEEVRAALNDDSRVPQMSVDRFLRELSIR